MLNVGIFLFNEVEVMDFAGPFEVFSVTSELNDYRLLKVFTISQDGDLIASVNNLKVQPDYSFSTHPKIDILIIPGGVGTKILLNNTDVLSWIKKNYEKSQITFSVCSGARLLGKIDVLDRKESTTHHEVIDHLKEIAPKAIINENKRFIDNGKIMTSAGISAGIDLSLYVVEKLFGKEVREKTSRYMEYGDWKK
jgi:transcriptional regulator GlxA family with amidase domain